METHLISKKVVKYNFSPDQLLLEEILKNVLEVSTFCIVANPDTSMAKWNSNTFMPYINDRTLYVFMLYDDAKKFSEFRSIVTDDKKPMVKKVEKSMLLNNITGYIDANFIDYIKVYINSPVCILFDACRFVGREAKAITYVSSLDNSQPASEYDRESGKEEYDYVSKVKEILGIYSKEILAKYHDAPTVLNLFEMVDKVLQQNKIQYAAFDAEMGFPNGFTEQFCKSSGNRDASYDGATVYKILDYFHLGEYIYRYQKYTNDIVSMLQSRKNIDLHPIREATLRCEEPFELQAIKRGRDKSVYNAYVYGLKFVSQFRTLNLTVSNPYGMVRGHKYSIEGLEPVNTGKSEMTRVEVKNAPAPEATMQKKSQVQGTEELEEWD